VTPPPLPFESAFRELIQTLEALPYPYCVLGALAVGIWGTPRTTQDLDAMISFTSADREHLERALIRQGFASDLRWANENPMLRTGISGSGETLSP
jgi:hypothetical protein